LATYWSAERRAKTRYPIELDVQFQTVQSGGCGEFRIGVTVNFSSNGFLISTAKSQIPVKGSRLHVMVEWPVPLGGKTPLQLVVSGRVVRAGGSTFALLFERYEFHTRKPRRTVP